MKLNIWKIRHFNIIIANNIKINHKNENNMKYYNKFLQHRNVIYKVEYQ